MPRVTRCISREARSPSCGQGTRGQFRGAISACTHTGVSFWCVLRHSHPLRSNRQKVSNSCELSSTVIESLRRKHLPTRSASTHRRTWTACGSLLKRPHEPERTTCHRQTDSDL